MVAVADDDDDGRIRSSLSVLGAFESFVPATVVARRLDAPRIFERHVALDLSLPSSLALQAANPGWEQVTVHAFTLRSDLAQPLNRRLRKLALALERSGDSVVVSNVGGFHSRRLEADPPIALIKLQNAAARAARAAHADEGGARNDRPTRPTSLWANVSRERHFHGLHDHEGSSWSGVYYPQLPPKPTRPGCEFSGRIVFRTAVGGLPTGGPRRRYAMDPSRPEGWCAYAHIDPTPGLLLIWPSWLLHCVLPVAAPDSEGALRGRARISYSFNFGES